MSRIDYKLGWGTQKGDTKSIYFQMSPSKRMSKNNFLKDEGDRKYKNLSFVKNAPKGDTNL